MGAASGEGRSSSADRGGVVLGGAAGVVLGDALSLAVAHILGGQIDVWPGDAVPLATQAINRGMSLEAIAAMLGHRSLDMTLRYAKIANRTVADEYFAVTDQVDARYGQLRSLPADVLGPQFSRLRREHHRHLGNGHCTRPDELDRTFDSICQTCSYFTTGPAFLPVLQAQRDDAQTKGQTGRADLFNRLLQQAERGHAS